MLNKWKPMNSFFYIISLVSSRLKNSFAFYLLGSTIIPFLDIFGISLIIPILNNFSNENPLVIPYIGELLNTFTDKMLFICFGTVFAIKILYITSFNFLTSYILSSFQNQITLKYFGLFNRMSFQFHDNNPPSELLKILRTDLAYIIVYFSAWSNLIIDSIVICILGSFLILIDSNLFLISSCILIISTILFYFGIKNSNGKLSSIRDIVDKNINKLILENYFGIRVLKNFKKDNLFSNNLLQFLSSQRKYNAIVNTIAASTKNYLELVLIVILLVLLYYFKINNFSMSEIISLITVLLLIAIRLLPVFSRIQSSLQHIQFYENSIVLNRKKIEENYLTEKNAYIPKTIQGIDISYSYKNKTIVQGLNFSIDLDDDKIVFIVGPSGSGKSTLIDIIMGNKRIDSGSLRINNEDVSKSNFSLNDIAYLSQTPFVFKGNLEENILFGRNFDETMLHKSINEAGVSQFIENKKPKDIKIDENGTNFSLGQLQRITIARALYGLPKIIFLDEPSSALDFETEQLIYNNLLVLSKKVKIVMVTHSTKLIDLIENKHLIKLNSIC